MIDDEGIKGGGLPISFIVRLEVGVPRAWLRHCHHSICLSSSGKLLTQLSWQYVCTWVRAHAWVSVGDQLRTSHPR